MSALAIFLRPLRWFRKAPKTDYEEVLEELTADIDHVQSNLVQVQARKRRATLILPFWAFVLWLAWTVLMYLLGKLSRTTQHAWIIWGPVIFVPFLIFFTRRIVRWWYKRVQAAEEKHLKELHRERRAKIEEIKKATRYDHLRLLLDKYDDEKKPVTSQQGRGGSSGPQTPVRGDKQQKHPQQQAVPASVRAPILTQQPLPSAMRSQQQTGLPSTGFVRPPQPPAQAYASGSFQRTWLDRVADSVLGADTSSAVLGPEQKYALICSSCKRHNGLAPKEEFDEVQYICPHCGVFNTRRPSSMPVSSPWKASQEANKGGPSSSSKSSGPGAKSISTDRESRHATSTSSLRKDGMHDVTDSPPPASPLGGKGVEEEEDEEEVGMEAEEHEIRDLNLGSRSGLSKRRTGRSEVRESD